jgi:hypothetical protein
MSNEAPLQIRTRSALTRTKVTGAAVALIAMSAIPAAATTASPPCAPRPELLKQLAKQFHEQPAALGLTSNGSLIEVLTSDDGETWTIMISQPNGSSCLVAAGASWEELKHAAKGERGA